MQLDIIARDYELIGCDGTCTTLEVDESRMKIEVPATIANADRTSSDYAAPPALATDTELIWDEDAPPAENYPNLGRALAAVGDLYRRPGYGSGLLLANEQANIEPIIIDRGAKLAPIIADRLRVRVVKGSKTRGSDVPARHLGTMLASEAFLQQFRPLDSVVRASQYQADFSLLRRGYTDGGHGDRMLYIGAEPQIVHGTEAIDRFLDVMAFASNADRTNALALTVMLRNHWPGAKPIGIVTSTKSHGGKDTIVAFAAGATLKSSIDYQSTDWAFRQSLEAAIRAQPDAGVVNVENARLGRGDQHIASATLERILTDSRPSIHSSKNRDVLILGGNRVFVTTTNFGMVSDDLMNRGLPIHLAPTGNVADRVSPIGNPKLEYLPANREQIEAELRGMIEKWKNAGQSLDDKVKHPFTDWARTIGGILLANGYTDFLANYSLRKTADDPLRKGLGLLGVSCPDMWLRCGDWAARTMSLGLVRSLIPDADRESEKSRERGIGVVLTAHRDETFVVQTDDQNVSLRLEKKRARFEGTEPSTRYRFAILHQAPLPEDADPELDVGH